jgi:hypothetical protein
LVSDSAATGIPLEPGAWMITVGEDLMMATSNSWIQKNTALNDWLAYSDHNGRPGLRASTAATPESPESNALETTLTNVLNDNAVVHSATDDIKVIDLAAGGHISFPELVDSHGPHDSPLSGAGPRVQPVYKFLCKCLI